MLATCGLLAEHPCRRQVFLRAAKTLQKANANGGKGGNGVNLGKKGKSFPKSFVIAGAM